MPPHCLRPLPNSVSNMRPTMKYNILSTLLGVTLLVSGVLVTTVRSAEAVPFAPPTDNSAPRQGTGGASRGSSFVPPSDNSAPRQGTGGASRGDLTFVPPSDNSAPRQGTGGASRNDVSFIPPPDNAAPRQATGGASRNDVFAPPTDNRAPRQTQGGAARTNDYGTNSGFSGPTAAMLALTPDSFYGTTLSERPTILVYLPASEAKVAIFSLKDEDQNLLYQTNLVAPTTGGVVAIQLPEEAPALEVGKNYQWFVTLQLEDQLTPGSPFVDAWIKRIEPTDALAQALDNATPLEQAEALAANGVWYDTAAILAQLQTDGAEADLASQWAELLSSVGLDVVAESPIRMAASL